MNAGEVVGKAGAAGIGAGLQMSYCLNVGRISGYSNVGGISASNSAFHSFSDEQMAPSSPYRDNSTRLQTAEMVGTALQSELGTDNWIYEDNMYPRLKWTETLTWLDGTPFPYVRDAAILASTPIYMKANEHVNNLIREEPSGIVMWKRIQSILQMHTMMVWVFCAVTAQVIY